MDNRTIGWAARDDDRSSDAYGTNRFS